MERPWKENQTHNILLHIHNMLWRKTRKMFNGFNMRKAQECEIQILDLQTWLDSKALVWDYDQLLRNMDRMAMPMKSNALIFISLAYRALWKCFDVTLQQFNLHIDHKPRERSKTSTNLEYFEMQKLVGNEELLDIHLYDL